MADDKKTEEKKEGKKEADAKKKVEEPELTEEDKALQDELNLLVDRLEEAKVELHKPALEQMRTHIRSSTSSMTSVPKPLKFLRPHFDKLKAIYEKMTVAENKRFCADVISVLAMTNTEGTETLQYRLQGSHEEIGTWGHEYVRHLAGEIAVEWNKDDIPKESLSKIALEIVPFNMKHNAEAEACDLLMEIEKLDQLDKFMDKDVFQRVCLYLVSCVNYVPEPEDSELLKTAGRIYRKFNRFPEAMRCAMQLNDKELINKLFFAAGKYDLLVQKQLAFMLGRQQHFVEMEEEADNYDDLTEIMSNAHLNTNFLALGRELDILEPKTPEDVFKSHLENQRPFGGATSHVDSARQNLASSFVNGFVNAAFGTDKLLTEDGNKWIYKNKEHGMMSAMASLGLLLLWDVDGGLTQVDKYLYSSEDYIKSGALLACGIVNTCVRNDCDPALALLSDYVRHTSPVLQIGSILGLGLAYAGSNREDVLQLLQSVFDAKNSREVVGITALACGLIACGTCNGEVSSALLQTLMTRSEAELGDTYCRLIPLALGLVHLGKQENADVVLSSLEVLADPMKSVAKVMVDMCAYAGTGNVLKIQELLHICSEHYGEKPETKEASSGDDKKDKKEEKKEGEKTEEEKRLCMGQQQSVAVLGIALIAMGEEIGSEMAFRAMGHLLRYGELTIRRSVPLALALLSPSNPKLNILDTLSKFSHDSDAEVAHNAIFAMGIVGAGTNNARLAAMLRQLAQYHQKDANNLFMVRLAQGLTHLGKGTLTLSPYHFDRSLLSPVSLAGLLSVMVCFLDVKHIILGRSHYLLYLLTTAMYPRMLVTFDEEMRPKPVTVRVGQAVDVVGQAGKPKTITGFQTHTTPVLLAYGERAELATEEFISLTPVMEGFCILRKNPDYEAEAV